ncbi:MAG TPA: sulfotransferase [Gaiellaceae bacterium]
MILVHIGYHKTGTSWLQGRLFGNPKSGMRWLGKSEGHPVRKLVAARALEFDAAAARAAFDPLLESARADGLLPVVSFERLTGHPFSGGYDAKEIADRLAAVFPEGRILVVMREQRAALLSTYKQYVRAGGVAPIERFLVPPRSKAMRTATFTLDHFDYRHLLRYYRGLFGAERVLALPFERFVRDGSGFVAEIGEFAGRPLSSDVLAALPYERRSNAAPTAGVIAVRRELNRLTNRSELNPEPLFASKKGARLAVKWSRSSRLASLTGAYGARLEREWRRRVEELVGDRYVEGNRETAGLVGADLGGYGWMV